MKRTTATAAANVYDGFLRKFPSARAIAEAREPYLIGSFANVGLQKQRAKSIKTMAQHLLKETSENLPQDLDGLRKIPGLGEYSARAVLSFGMGIPAAVVDSNVERVLSRVFLSGLPPKPSPSVMQELADYLLPRRRHRDYNLGLLDLGALVCKYVDPLCDQCPLNVCCDYYQLGRPSLERRDIGLRKVRKEKGFGLAKLAQVSGVSKTTILKIESGKTSPKEITLEKLAKALGVDAGIL